MTSTTDSPLCQEHLPLLQGRGRYIDDINLPDTVHVAFVRSPYAHARLVAVETEAAAGRPGVVAVFSGRQLRASIKPIHPLLREASFQATDWYPLAWDKVRYMGEAVAVVVAVDRYYAEDAAEHVVVQYEPLPAITSAAAGLAAGSPQIHEELAGNVLLQVSSGTKQDEEAFENGEVRVRGTFQHPRVTGLAIENCGVLADYRPETDELIVWSSTQVPHLLRDALGECLNHATQKLRVIAPHVGGGFGIKMQALPEEVVVAYLARRLGRPVKWTQDRLENLQASLHARDCRVEAELVAHSDGTLIGLRAKAFCDVGAYNSFPLTCALEPFTIAGALPGPYRFPYYAYEGYAVATNKCPVGAYRGVGFVLGPLAMEGLIDKLARQLALDPAEIRQKNLARPEAFPFTSPGGPIYDSGDYPALLDLALEQADYRVWRQQQQTARAEGRLLGIGLSCFVEVTGMGRGTYRKRGMVNIPAFDSAILRVDRRGQLEAFISTPSQGQGQCTTFAQLLAQEMGLPFADIRIHLGDTATCPYGSGTFASRSLVSGGGALLKAAGKLREKLVQLAATHWQVDPSQVTYAGGVATVQDNSSGQSAIPPDRNLTLYELAQLAYTPFQELPPELEPGLEVHQAYDPPPAATSAAVHLALVEVDAGTGQVTVHDYVVAEDCGRIVNQNIVDGQVRGGVAQGIGTALWEEIVYDQQGQLLSGSLLDYLVPGVYEAPHIQIVHLETPSPWTEGGFKGVGESGTIGAPAAITNAVLDALGANPTDIRLPLTPERVLGLKQEAR